MWVRPLKDDEFAVGMVSYRTDGRPQPLHFTLKQAGLKETQAYLCADLFDENHNSHMYAFDEKITLYIAPDNIIMWRCYPQKFASPEVAKDFDQL